MRQEDGTRDAFEAVYQAIDRDGSKARVSPKRCSHSDVPLYISLVIIHTEYTGVRQNDSNV